MIELMSKFIFTFKIEDEIYFCETNTYLKTVTFVLFNFLPTLFCTEICSDIAVFHIYLKGWTAKSSSYFSINGMMFLSIFCIPLLSAILVVRGQHTLAEAQQIMKIHYPGTRDLRDHFNHSRDQVQPVQPLLVVG